MRWRFGGTASSGTVKDDADEELLLRRETQETRTRTGNVEYLVLVSGHRNGYMHIEERNHRQLLSLILISDLTLTMIIPRTEWLPARAMSKRRQISPRGRIACCTLSFRVNP